MTRKWTASAGIVLGAMAMGPVQAQEVSVPSVTTASPGGYANPLKLDTDRYDREQRNKRNKKRAQRPSPECSADSLPIAERRRLEDQYMRIARDEGRARADVWVREEGMRYRMHLVREGVCPPPTVGERADFERWRAQQRRAGLTEN